jgi:hypothetical protein
MMLSVVLPIEDVIGVTAGDMSAIAGLGIGQGDQQTRIDPVRGAGIIERLSVPGER